MSSLYEKILMAVAAIRIICYKLKTAIFGAPTPIVLLEVRVLCLGLDGAGKTSILARAASGEAPGAVEPTSGFHVRPIVSAPWRLELWDIGGAPAVRPFWRRYAAPETRALVWVVDASDAARLAESAAALAPMLAEPRLARLPLLVFANKADVGGWDAGVVTDDAITAALGLGGRAECQLVRCSAVDGRCVADGFEWLARALERREQAMRERT